MKSILITGSNGYVGNEFKRWMTINDNFEYQIETIGLRNNTWMSKDFSTYDVILHLAAIVHSPSANPDSYYKVNRDLTLELAKKAKKQGVEHFVFFSTLSVYGITTGHIGKDTQVNPLNDYGKSKLEAENLLLELECPTFKITIIRSPIIYGLNAPGNFTKLVKLFRLLPLFPKIENKKSMVFIDTLSEFIYSVIHYQISGIFIPQNKEYVSVLSMYRCYKRLQNKYYFLVPFFLTNNSFAGNSILSKIFGNLTVEKNMSSILTDYQSISFEETIFNSIKEPTTNE